jgi:pyruvate,orthophosphate dikinase
VTHRQARARERKHVYAFGDGRAEGNRNLRDLLGGKGANLAEMASLGLPVPAGFTISTEVCTWYSRHGGRYPQGLAAAVAKALAAVETSQRKRFGDAANPLLLSVRSGARVSMPGMMDTILNLGLNAATAAGLAARSGNARFAWDAYRRFVQMYADVVLGVRARPGEHHGPLGKVLEDKKRERGVREDTELDAADLEDLVARLLALVKKRTGRPFPDDPEQQLWGAIGAVFRSWNNERAKAYRAMNQIPGDWGTGVNVMAMVFGNLGPTSGTGVAFTRDPATGAKRFYGEYLMNAQGEDVVAGLRTPKPIEALRASLPRVWRELAAIQATLEAHFRDMQDLEFTIEEGRLFMLQCRAGKRTGFAAVRIATDLVREGRITKREALARVEPSALDQILQPVFDAQDVRRARDEGRLLTRGLNAGPGAASGRIAFDPDEAVRRAKAGESVILVRIETSPEDIKGMQAAKGILTAQGGMTSHAALVARQMGKVCVAGAGELAIDYAQRRVAVGGRTLGNDDWISLDGSTGEVFAGELPTEPSSVATALFGSPARRARARKAVAYRAYAELMRWADAVRTLGVRTNADQPDQCRRALAFGAEGIGLCRTEHMFFGEGKIERVQRMILADSRAEREAALAELLPLQRRDFAGIFEVMGSRPVTIRTLDPPLHEFLPHDADGDRRLAQRLGLSPEQVAGKVRALREANPMLGHRGCRLGITYPEITRTQARAIFEAACAVKKKTRKTPAVEVMIPLVATARELELQAAVVREAAADVFRAKRTEIPFLVGTMIELPRAALVAGEIARTAEFFSFGTNDLTQTTFGISRDDGASFVPFYVEHAIYPDDPFATLDVPGVGRLMEIASSEGRAARRGLKLGICGEHGGDPRTIAVCQRLGLDYVSCSPYRVPIARLAAAQAALAAPARAARRRPGG